MISSISKKHTTKKILLPALVLTLAGCADKPIRPLPETLAPVKAQLVSTPTQTSTDNSPFKDQTDDYGLSGIKAIHLYAVDVNDDGATDLVTMDDFVATPKFYLFNKKTKKFSQTDYNPFNEVIRGSFLNFIDLDHDDVLDVIVGNLNQKSELTKFPVRLYKGSVISNKITYTLKNVLQTGIVPTASVAAGDFNLDGEIDLFLGNWFSQLDDNPKPIADGLFYGKGFSYANVSNQLKDEDTYPAPTFGATICDVDKNGFPDVLTANSNGYYNKMWLNMDGENFTDFGVPSGYAADNEGSAESKGGGNSFFSLCGDYNNDQLVDVITGNLFKDSDPEYRDKSVVLSGSSKGFPPTFYRTEFFQQEDRIGYAEGNRRGVWIDFNADGLNDFLIANSGFPPDSRLMLFEQERDHAYEERAKDYGLNLLNPSGMVTLDVNNDGMMDFISGQSNVRASEIEQRLFLFVNQTKHEGKTSVRFFPEGRRSNSRGLSSSITITTDKTKRFATVDYANGPLPSQNEEGIYFGLNKEKAKEVEVRWSYGTEDRLNRVIPMIKKYSLANRVVSGKHNEFNLCDDGRILPRKNHCYR